MSFIGQILDFQKVDAKKMLLRVAEYDLTKQIKLAVKRFDLLAEQSAITIAVNDSGQLYPIYIDAIQMDKVFTNLIHNAIKYAGPGSKLTISIDESDSAFTLSFTDNGRGIHEPEQQKVFERYYQSRNVQHLQQPGTGLGLALVKEIIVAHCGDIQLTSVPNEKTEFTISLLKGAGHFETAEGVLFESRSSVKVDEPVVSEASGTTQFSEIPPRVTFEASQGLANEDHESVLIVDDNPELLSFLCGHLALNYRVETANNGLEAFEKAQRLIPDIIVSDVMMPELDGYGLVKKVRGCDETAFIPIILLTAKATKHDVVDGLSIGANDYLTKPFDLSELVVRIDGLLNQRKQLRYALENCQPSGVSPPPFASNIPQTFAEKTERAAEEMMAEALFTTQELADKLAMDRTTLFRRFKREGLGSPSDFLRVKRLELASTLLKERRGSVSEVAYACGFGSVSSFSSGFKKHYQVTPSTYLKAS